MFIKSATFSISILPMALITLISYRYELRESQLDGRSELPVYNYVSDVNNLTWGQYMSLARQGYHEPFDKSLWWVHTHSTVPQSTHRYKYALFEFQFCGTLSVHESLPYAMARRRLIQMLKYCCISAVLLRRLAKFIYTRLIPWNNAQLNCEHMPTDQTNRTSTKPKHWNKIKTKTTTQQKRGQNATG